MSRSNRAQSDFNILSRGSRKKQRLEQIYHYTDLILITDRTSEWGWRGCKSWRPTQSDPEYWQYSYIGNRKDESIESSLTDDELVWGTEECLRRRSELRSTFVLFAVRDFGPRYY